MQISTNTLLAIFFAGALGAVFYYLNQNDYPIPNEGAVPQAGSLSNSNINMPLQPQMYDNRKADEIGGNLVADIVSQYTMADRPIDGGMGSFTASDPMSDSYGSFSNYGKKRQINNSRMDNAFSDDIYESRDFSERLHRMRGFIDDKVHEDHASVDGSGSSDFTYKKRPFTKSSTEDIKDRMNSQYLLPNEIENGWFDVAPLINTKHITDTHLLHPKVHMGVNTVGSSLRNGTHDIRGDIPNPKLNVSPWNNSTIEPDTNIKGICSSI